MNTCVVWIRPDVDEVIVYTGFSCKQQAEAFINNQENPDQYLVAKQQKPRELPAW